MKIYVGVSISQMSPEIRENCEKIVAALKQQGHTVLPKNILTKSTDHYSAQSEEESLQAQKRLTKLKKQADLMIFEVTNQSLGIGQEIALALSMNKPVIALYKQGHAPHLLRDEGGDLLILDSYTRETLAQVLADTIDYASTHQDVRFNFFISSRIGQYLDWVANTKKIPRSVYLRNLIKKDMAENEKYQGGA